MEPGRRRTNDDGLPRIKANTAPTFAEIRMQAQDPLYEARVRESLARQEFMELLGVTLTRIVPGEVHLSFPVRDQLKQQHGVVHAGALASAMDSAAGYAAFTLMPEGSGVVSVEFKVNLLEPARGDRIEARARVVRAGRTLTSVAAEAWAVDAEGERLVATFSGTMMCLVGRAATG